MEVAQIPFKIRASKASELTTGSVGLTDAQKATLEDFESRKDIKLKPITDKQRETLKTLHAELMEKGLSGKKEEMYLDLDARKDIEKTPLTPKMVEDMIELRDKAKNNDLPQTVKTLVINWLDDILHQQTDNFSNKYTRKGNEVEEQSLVLIAQYLGIPDFALYKNEDHFENEWACGTPDALPLSPKIVVDAKSSWSHRTFPLHKKNVDPKYWSQMQIYMWLTGRQTALVAHTLVNTPEPEIKAEAYNLSRELGVEYSEEIFEQVKVNHVHDHKPLVLRVKGFEVNYDSFYIDEIKRRVPMAKNYIKNILEAKPELEAIFLKNTSQGIHLF